MHIAVLKETDSLEARVAASPETVKKLVAMGADVRVEKGAGVKASMLDEAYRAAGATIAASSATAVKNADVILGVQAPDADAEWLDGLKQNAIFIAQLAPFDNPALLKTLAEKSITSVSLELVPRITRAQSMDVLSSQSNLAGYRAVIEAANEFGRAFPMMMTAAGTVPPARILVLGAGVAGLQAIATAKRLGGVVSAFDVRAAAKEQVESLGGTFVEVPQDEDAETAGGYAKEMSEDYKKRQTAKVKEVLAKSDIAICTALIPGKPAPVLITKDMVEGMKAGSVIVDLAAERGGNCELTEAGKRVVKHDVVILGYKNVPSRIPGNAATLYAKNVLSFLELLIDKTHKTVALPLDDEIIKGTLLTYEGKIVHPNFAPAAA